MHSDYSPPLALTILSGIFLILGAICFAIIAADIFWRRGWQSMMWIMIPVYTINAAYMLPLELYVYFKFGRPTKPATRSAKVDDTSHPTVEETSRTTPGENDTPASSASQSHGCHDSDVEKGSASKPEVDGGMSHCHHNDASRPMWATVLVGVSHCGAGCVLGDLVGEWLVYGTNATLGGEMIWVELLVDYAFALLFGVAFQYFSIAPMSGEYGPKTVWRALKADFLSLTSFEVGAFAWMIIYQVGIFNYRLSMTTWTYWWMMQIGMALGFATAFPMNWFLITKGIKEPCA